MIYEHSELSRRAAGPRIAAIGGGTGLSTMLRGLKKYTDRLTAIVTVADDGGGSGLALGIVTRTGAEEERQALLGRAFCRREMSASVCRHLPIPNR